MAAIQVSRGLRHYEKDVQGALQQQRQQRQEQGQADQGRDADNNHDQDGNQGPRRRLSSKLLRRLRRRGTSAAEEALLKKRRSAVCCSTPFGLVLVPVFERFGVHIWDGCWRRVPGSLPTLEASADGRTLGGRALDGSAWSGSRRW